MIRHWFRSLLARPGTSHRNHKPRVYLGLEALEERAVPTIFTVTNGNDDGPGSLRVAIASANNEAVNPGADIINFAAGVNTVTLTTGGQLFISSNMTISGPTGGTVNVKAGTPTFALLQVDSGITATLENLTISGGNGYQAGGITNFGTLTINSSTVSGNTGFVGGGIHNAGTLVINASTISGNNDGGSSGGQGGGIYNSNNGTVTITNSTISGNSEGGTTGQGGGIFNFGTLTINSSTLSNNSATQGGGIYNVGTATLKNTIVANSTGGDLSGAFSGSFNLIEDGSGTGLTNTVTGDPALGNLANNGGPTQTHAITKTSKAFNAGSNALVPSGLTTDQRGPGFFRIVGPSVDIGAFEVPNFPPTNVSAGGPYTINEGQSLTLSGSAIDPDGDPLTYTWDVNGDGTFGDATGNNPTLTWAALNALGISDGTATSMYNVKVRVSDSINPAVDSPSTTLKVLNANPVAAISDAPISSPEGTAISLGSNITDVAADLPPSTIAWTVTKNGNAYANGSGATFSFTPDDNGSYVVTMTATDKDGGSGSDSESITITNVVPQNVNGGADQTVNEGTTVNLSGSFTDPGTADTHTQTWSVSASNGQVINNGNGATFSFVPNDNGTYTVTYTVTDDDSGTASDTVVVTVNNANPTATINGAPANSPEGTAISLSSTVTDPGSADTHTYSWAVTKNGNAYASGTNSTFGFTPDDNGTYVVTLTVTDDDGGVGTDSNSITVTNVAPQNVNGGADQTVNEGTTVNLSGSFTDPGTADTHTQTWSVSASNGQVINNGNGATFSFVPNDNGTYTVTYTVTDDDSGTTSDMVVVTVNNVAPQNVNAGADQTVNEGATVNLSGTFSDPGSADTHTQIWSVVASNGQVINNGSGASFSFVPNDNGTYTVTYTVTDDDSGSASDVVVITVNNVAPQNVNAGADQTVNEGTTVNLSGTFSDPGSADTHTQTWKVTASNGQNIADGSGASFSFVPNDNGTYTVTYTVTDDDSGSASDVVVITVNNVAPQNVNAGADQTVNEGATVNLSGTFSDPGSADTHTQTWSVSASNGQVINNGSGSSFSFVPNDNGTYTVTYTVTDDDSGSASDTVVITVNNANPTPTITGDPASSPEGTVINLGSTVTDAGAADTHTFGWAVTKNGNAYGSGTNSTFSFTPDDNGTYVVTLTVTDDDGGVGTASKSITVNNVVPQNVNAGADQTVNEGATVNLSGTFSDPGSADTHTQTWKVTASNGQSIADGSGASFSFVPNDNGIYTVLYTVTDDDSGSASDTVVITVNNANPTATITGDPASSPEGTVISLGSTVNDAGAADTHTYSWAVTKNGNAYASGTSASFNFTPNDNGTYVVNLTVTDDDGGVGTDSKSITVTNVAPQNVNAGADQTVNEGATVNLSGTFSDPGSADTHTQTWSVSASNGQVINNGSGSSFSFVPNDNGIYTVLYTVTDDDSGSASDTVVITVNNVAPQNVNAGADQTVNEGATVNLSGTFTDPGSADTHTQTWKVTASNGQVINNGSGASFSFVPNDNGIYTVLYTVTDDDSGTTSDTVVVTVNNVNPVAAITGAPASGTPGVVINLGSLINDVAADLPPVSIAWTVTKNGNPYANGSGANFSFTPDDTGTYVVTLTATDKDGGVGTDTKIISGTNAAPENLAIAGPTFTVRGYSTTWVGSFTDPDALDTHMVKWDFGDGTIIDFQSTTNSGALTPSHAYKAVGNYTITMTVKDFAGATASKTLVINVGVIGLMDDPFFPGGKMLVGGGDDGVNDQIYVQRPTLSSNQIRVKLSPTDSGTYFSNTMTRILLYGQGGDDYLYVDSTLMIPVWAFGGSGNDRIYGGASTDVLVGGSGEDIIAGNGGRDIIIGGDGEDILAGGEGDDIVISGRTSYDANEAALKGLLTEWSSSRNYPERVANIRSGGGDTGGVKLVASGPNATVFNDTNINRITGMGGQDWFFAWADPTTGNLKDIIGDLFAGGLEEVDKIS